MTRIYLIRHAQSEGNLYRRILGWYDGHVTSSGRAQITALKNRFLEIPVDAVYSSDLSRAWETAQAVALPQKLDIHPEPAFRELHIGEFTNIPYGDLHYHHPDLYDALFSFSPLWAPKGGERFQQVAFFRLAHRHSGQSVAIFSHAMAIHCLQASLQGKHPSQFPLPSGENTAVSCYELQDDRVDIRFENDISHLPNSLTARLWNWRRRKRGSSTYPPGRKPGKPSTALSVALTVPAFCRRPGNSCNGTAMPFRW